MEKAINQIVWVAPSFQTKKTTYLHMLLLLLPFFLSHFATPSRKIDPFSLPTLIFLISLSLSLSLLHFSSYSLF
ncbi:hypothetical protein RIF29_18050 [Crotalaria pallida]|uniref:Uncharacterized protein n=1 Tax=Crotalaria pallida TaxID=3830 RepID=A0AAN9FIA2_CROPI